MPKLNNDLYTAGLPRINPAPEPNFNPAAFYFLLFPSDRSVSDDRFPHGFYDKSTGSESRQFVSGNATISRNQAKIEELWEPFAKT